MAQPAWLPLAPTPAGARQASSATPTKPSASPAQRSRLMRSPSHSQATSAPNSGTVALRIDVSPVAMCITAQANSANGIAELMSPANSTGRQWRRSAGHSPRCSRKGQRNRAAISTRSPAMGSGPNSAAPRRMKRNDAPHKLDSNTNSPTQAGAWGERASALVCGAVMRNSIEG